jgi:hypothetical protein
MPYNIILELNKQFMKETLMYEELILRKQKVIVDSFSFSLALETFRKELNDSNDTIDILELIEKVESELFHVRIFGCGALKEEKYLGYLNKRNCQKIYNIPEYIYDNERGFCPMIDIFKDLGLTERAILKILGLKKAIFLQEPERYNDYRYYHKNKELALKFSRALLKKKVFRTKISILLGLTYQEVHSSL